MDKAKYLGAPLIPRYLRIITSTPSRRNNTTAFLRQNLSSCPPDAEATCYKPHVCPQLEYASRICNPNTQSNINKTEAVQRGAARFVTGEYKRTSSVLSMLEHLGREDLHIRRQHGKMVLMFRIVNHLVEIPASTIL